MTTADAASLLENAREAYRRRDWVAAREGFSAARELAELPVDDVNALADAAWWVGAVDESLEAAEEAYRRFLQGDRPAQAAMSALQVGYSLYLRGDDVMGSGWMSRAQRLLRDVPETVEHGYLLYMDVEAGLDGPDLDTIVATAERVQDFGRRYDDPNLRAVGTMGAGRALLRQGKVTEGMALLDEAGLAVRAGDLTPDWAGNIYCHLIAACYELADLRRAGEWIEALTTWCEQLSPATLFTGICRVHRAQVFQLHGSWAQAEAEAERVCEELATIHPASVAEGSYAIGEIRRLRGDLTGAERAYLKANDLGRDPQPGLALLRLSGGDVEAATASIRAALAGTSERLPRARLLEASVEIALAADDLGAAVAACEELERITSVFASSGLEAATRRARGAVLLRQGQAGAALEILHDACRRWRDLRAPYEAAKVRLLLAEAYRGLGDDDAASRELDAAEEVFAQLGAPLEAARAAELRTGATPHLPGGLTAREAEVLGLVATGGSNHEVATALFISEKTVARHLSNIFTKLGVASRTEAAAYAFANGLAHPSRG